MERLMSGVGSKKGKSEKGKEEGRRRGWNRRRERGERTEERLWRRKGKG